VKNGVMDSSLQVFNGLPREYLAHKVLYLLMMSLSESILENVAEPAVNTGDAHETSRDFDSARHISPAVAHELNNVITIIQGYADRLLSKNRGNAELEPQLKLISEAARRAAGVVRDAKLLSPGSTGR